MTISLILIRKIVSLFIVMFAGYFLVKMKLIKTTDTKALSVISVYLVAPCVIVSAFQVDFTPEVQSGLLLALIGALISQTLYVILAALLSRVMHFDAVEKMSIAFSNAGGLIIPLVYAILGSEWVIYSSAYIAVQLAFLWSYGKATICGERKIDLKKIFTNTNIISILIGIVFLITGLRLPPVIQDAADELQGMMGAAIMLILGMIMAGMDLKKMFSRRRLWLVTLFRLVIFPIFMLLILKFSGLAGMAPDGKQILLITLLAGATPSATTIVQMAIVYGKDADYASAINVLTTLLCIVTMPVFVMLYMM